MPTARFKTLCVGRVVAASVLCNRLVSGTVALTFLSLKNAIGIDKVSSVQHA